MPHDFANHKKSPPPPSPDAWKWTWFFAGTATGASAMFLAMLWYFVEPSVQVPDSVSRPAATPEENQSGEETEWSFYNLLSKAVVPIAEGYRSAGEKNDGTKIIDEAHPWILQVGSFKDPKDADNLRAELILLGMNVATQRIKVNGEKWNRVVVGPFDSARTMNQARHRLADARIMSIQKKASSE